jgi:23S rRNA pseudouridine955/2504/2580 synthase
MNIDKKQISPKVRLVKITDAHAGQRLDNFLITQLKGVPKSHIYRIVRKGEVRVNKGRIEVSYKLAVGDEVRIPPIRVAEQVENVFVQPTLKHSLEQDILYEDDAIIVLNKPSGFAVHGGSGINAGVIEGLRELRPQAKFLELAHRLDKETSGCLIIAKKRSALNALHEMFRGDGMQKTYLALLAGRWERKKLVVNQPLLKNIAHGGERIVVVSKAGKESETLFRRMEQFKNCTLVEASPKTGRTHQIRVHAAWLGHPIIGDERYGDENINHAFKKRGYTRLFLHALRLKFSHPLTGEVLNMQAPLPKTLTELLDYERKVSFVTHSPS